MGSTEAWSEAMVMGLACLSSGLAGGQDFHQVHLFFGFLPQANRTEQQLRVLLALLLGFDRPGPLLLV